MKTNKKPEKMPKKRKQGACLHYHEKHYRPGNTIIRIRNNGIEQNTKYHFTSTEPKQRYWFVWCNWEWERTEELDEKKQNDNYFQQQQRIAFVFIYEHIFCELEKCDWKRYNMINNIIDNPCLHKNAHQMVLNV